MDIADYLMMQQGQQGPPPSQIAASLLPDPQRQMMLRQGLISNIGQQAAGIAGQPTPGTGIGNTIARVLLGLGGGALQGLAVRNIGQAAQATQGEINKAFGSSDIPAALAGSQDPQAQYIGRTMQLQNAAQQAADQRAMDKLAAVQQMKTAGEMQVQGLKGQQERDIAGLRGGTEMDIAKMKAMVDAGQLHPTAEGVLYNPTTGQSFAPPPDVQQYLTSLKTAGKPTTDVKVQNLTESALGKGLGEMVVGDVKSANEDAAAARNVASTSRQITDLLQGQPTGTLTADAQYQLSKQLGGLGLGNLTPDQVATRQAAEALSGETLLTQAKKLYPVSNTDEKFLKDMNVGVAQSPEGRANLTYILGRTADFKTNLAMIKTRLAQEGAGGQRSPAEINELATKAENQLRDQYAKTFNPPYPNATAAPAKGAPAAAAPSSAGKRWVRDAQGNLVPAP